MEKNIILKVENLVKTYPLPSVKIFEKRKAFTAVNNISFEIAQGETVGLIGESGCGKTTVGRIVTRLLKEDSGRVIFEGMDITSSSKNDFKDKRSKIQMIFQDPSTALNPQFRIEKILGEALNSIGIKDKNEQRNHILPLIAKVGMTEEYLGRYPHELSGGQKQRICILLALLTNPSFIVADEIVSALDLSVQAQILNLMGSLQREFNLAILFISHDLNIIYYMSDRIIVMYMGEIVESGPCEDVYRRGRHPYTQLLLSSLLTLKADTTKGESKDSGDVVRGNDFCIFSFRCPYSTDKCLKEKPVFEKVGPEHWVKCHHIEFIGEDKNESSCNI
jgi:peptide/nickel transport system ATP-binding protein/oligopeptide transport system ATP-binding protein